MTEHSAATGRDRFLRAVQKELAEAERREREFNEADREERAAKLGIPAGSGQVGVRPRSDPARAVHSGRAERP